MLEAEPDADAIAQRQVLEMRPTYVFTIYVTRWLIASARHLCSSVAFMWSANTPTGIMAVIP